jgi:hypothetical protein
MGRWRWSGTNWESRFWIASEAIVALGTQVEADHPAGHATDGTVAGKQHDQVNPSSDHRPHPFTGPGMVRAIDIGVDPGDQLAEQLRDSRDARIKYVIHKGRKFQGRLGPDPWEWKPYLGANPHDTHVHLSVLTAGDSDDSPWNLEGTDMPLTEADITAIANRVWGYPMPVAAGVNTQQALSRASTNAQATFNIVSNFDTVTDSELDEAVDELVALLPPAVLAALKARL